MWPKKKQQYEPPRKGDSTINLQELIRQIENVILKKK